MIIVKKSSHHIKNISVVFVFNRYFIISLFISGCCSYCTLYGRFASSRVNSSGRIRVSAFPICRVAKRRFSGAARNAPFSLITDDRAVSACCGALGFIILAREKGASLYTAGAAAASGSLAGSLVALIILGFFGSKRKETTKRIGKTKMSSQQKN